MIPRFAIAVFSFLALLGAAGAQPPADSAAPTASAQGDELLLVESGSSNLWIPQPMQGKPPRYSDKLMHRRVESCAAVGMVIESDGRTSGHRILNVHMRPEARERDADLRALVEAWALGVARNYRFAPGPDNPEAAPGYTAVVLNVALGSKGPRTECEVDDLRAAIASAQTAAP